jgi:O-antigen/teichoic acid export membrane protein
MHYILPQLFSRNYSTGQKYNQSLFNVSTRIMLSMSIPLMILIALAGKLLLGWFGDEFKTGYTCLLLLTAAQFIFSMAILYNTVLMTQDNEKQAAFCLLIFCLSLIISNILLIPSKGISGAGWAGLISSVIYYIVVAANGYRLKKILPHFLTRLK